MLGWRSNTMPHWSIKPLNSLERPSKSGGLARWGPRAGVAVEARVSTFSHLFFPKDYKKLGTSGNLPAGSTGPRRLLVPFLHGQIFS